MDTARQLLASRGYEALTMRDLAAESEVALKTLYRIYGNKDKLLQSAIAEQYRGAYEAIDQDTQPVGLDRVFFIAESIAARVLEEASYIKALSKMTSSQAMLETLTQLRTEMYTKALEQMRSQDDLCDFVSIPFLASSIGVHIGSLFRSWANDGFGSNEMFDRVRMEVIFVLSPFAVGHARERLQTMTKQVYNDLITKVLRRS
ncbi:MAG: helix-turn-helix domain-containing protein [Pseudomonadota bacterium]